MDRPFHAPNKGQQAIRSSKFSLSSLKAIIRRKTKDDNAVINKNPYPAQSRRDSKPYMSQPVLALSKPTAQSLDIDADDVSDQSAPSDHSSLTINRYSQPHILGRARNVSAQSTVSNNSSFIIKTQPNSNGGGTATVYATLPANVGTSEEYLSISSKPGGLYKPLVGAVGTPPTPASKGLPPLPTITPSWSSSSSEDTVGPNTQVDTTTPKVNKIYTSTNCSPLIMYSSTPTLPSESSPATSDGRNSINSSDQTSHSPITLSALEDSSSSVPDILRPGRVNPKLTVNTTLDFNNSNTNNAGPNSSINTTSSQRPILPPIQPRRTVSGAPRLSLPPANYRFSLNLTDGYSARLSPSVILRPPPLPLLNLPMLSGSTSTTGTSDADSRRSRRAGLMSMPALPRQGSSRGAAGHEEFDDVAEGDDDEEEDGDGDAVDEDDDGDDGDDVSAGSTPLEDELDTPRSGYSSSASETILSSRPHSCTPSVTPSYGTAHAEPSTSSEGYFDDLTRPLEKKFSRSSFLPPVDMSRIDLSFLNSPPSSDNKGKGKSKELTEDAGRTPIAVVRPNRNSGPTSSSTPIAFSPKELFIPEEATTNTWGTSPVLTKEGQALSPTQTPRAGGHFNFPLPVPIPPSPPRPILPTRSTDNRLSMNTLTQFPGTYKRASRSLIDVHALEKKEKVEQMVREEEEGAEEERKRRVKAMRMSMRVAFEGANATATLFDQQDKDDDGQQPKTSLHPVMPRRVSLAPHWADEEDDHIKASQAGVEEASLAPVKQPRGADNRISMAPAYDTIIPLRRRLSMPTFNSTSTSPPPYPDLFPGQTYGIKLAQIQPRDDEGREKLPAYSNSIYLKAIMPRKVEFSRPGVQAKDRKWKRVLCVLEGTCLKVYKPPGVSVIGGWWESKVGTGDMAVQITTTSSFNSGNVGVGVTNTIAEGKEEMEREGERTTGRTTWTPSNQGQATSRSRYPSNSPYSSGVLPATKSALNLAVHLLKPSSRNHGRTISDVGQSSSNSAHQSPRPSLNIPRNARSSTPTPTIASTTTGTSVSSSRSPSPMFASSSSLLTTSATSSSSHRSVDSTSSSIAGGGSATSRMVNNNINRTAAAATSSKGKKKVDDSDLEPHPHNLIKAYTMQNAECGLGTDYLKRKHVIRVRLEGEQFLLQARNVDNVIEWIEGLQAATNVAMDLDERPMPRGPLFPRRRRRRRMVVATTINTAGIPQHTTRRSSPTGNTPVDALQLAPPLV